MIARVVLATACALALSASATAATKHTIDPVASAARFTVHHIFVETVTGSVPVTSGSVDLPDGSLVPTSIAVSMDPARVKTGDDDRDGVLQTPDWFDVKKFPVWTFVSTGIVPETATKFGVDGVLTVHGIGTKIHLDVTAKGDAAHPQYHAVGEVDRRVFQMAKTRLDPVIGNDVALEIDARLK